MIRKICRIVAVTILGASLAPSSFGENITLTWTAPGDDGTVGTAAAYELRYSTHGITALNWFQAMPVIGLPIPRSAGTVQSFTLANLDPAQTYYFAMRARDEAGNWSPVSNNAVWALCDCRNRRGNADGDPEDRVTVSDLLHLIHYVFRGQAGLPCLEEANINGSPDGIIDVADVNLLIAHLYREDQVFLPAPCQ